MKTLKVTLSVLVLAATLMVAPATSTAAITPPSGPMTIHSYGFENTGWINSGSFTPTYDSHWSVTKNPQPPTGITATYIWGPEPNSKHSGSYGLWCSAYDTATKWYSFNWPTYSDATSGRAVLSLPELSDYYSAELKFWYVMPTRGAADSGSFVLAWGPGSVPDMSWEADTYFSLVSPWTQLTYDLSSELSRQSGQIWWEFNNKVEGGEQYPAEGQGPTIDDVQVLGYMYGPVRDLAAVSGLSGVDLSWSRPFGSVNSTTLESRSIEYRVWRRPQSAAPTDPWTELTDGAPITTGATDVDYTDTTATQGVTYNYRVVTYGSGSTTQYGQTQEVVGRYMTIEVDVQASASPSTIASGGSVTYTYRVTNSGSTPLTNIVVTDSQGVVPGSPPVPLLAGDYYDYTRTVNNVTVAGAMPVSATADGVGSPSTDSVYVNVLNPSISISVEPTVRYANSGKPADFDVVVQNTGDTDLSNIRVNLGSTLVTLDSLPVGSAAHRLPMSKAVSSDSLITASVLADYLPGQAVSNSTNTNIEVVASRISDSDRISTAIAASKRLYPNGITTTNADGKKAVVIATGFDFPDALSASALAGAAGGPLLLVNKDYVSGTVATELSRLHATKAYVVGGTGVVSPLVETTLRNRGLEVVRVAGSNRYETAQDVSAEVKRLVSAGAGTVDTVFLATGTNFPDALAASSLAAAMPAPVLLTDPNSLPAQTKAALSSLRPSTVVVCGGTAAVSSTIASQIDGNSAYGSPDVVRVAGDNRYDTAKRLNQWGATHGLESAAGTDGVFLATGEDYPDALAGGALAGGADGMWRPLMLTKQNELSAEARALITGIDHISFVTVVGGTAAVSDSVRTAAMGLIQ